MLFAKYYIFIFLNFLFRYLSYVYSCDFISRIHITLQMRNRCYNYSSLFGLCNISFENFGKCSQKCLMYIILSVCYRNYVSFAFSWWYWATCTYMMVISVTVWRMAKKELHLINIIFH